jgi:DNA repair exonuclease SbcCD ATPase subunit
MNKTAKQIETELDQTINRLGELNELHRAVADELKTLQDGFVSGKTPLDKVQTAQGKLTILNDSVTALETRRDELQIEFDKSAKAGTRRARLESLKAIATETQAFFKEYIAARAEMDAVIGPRARKIFNKLAFYRQAQKVFLENFRQLEPGIMDFERIPLPAQNSVRNIKRELANIGLTDELFNLATAISFRVPELEFGSAVSTAEIVLIDQATRKNSEKVRAGSDAKRFGKSSSDEGGRLVVKLNK